MTTDEPMPRRAADQPTDGPPSGVERSSRARLAVMVLAVGLAGVGLLSLAAILVTAFSQETVWPGFVVAAYFCLPIAFLLMVSLVIRSAITRRRS